MIKYLVVGVLLSAISGTSVGGVRSGLPPVPANPVTKAGLVLDGSDASSADATTDPSESCAHVAFSRNLRYGESDLNVLDVATADAKETSPRPVLLFVAGESFSGEAGAPDIPAPLQDEAMCFAARNGMVGVKMTYRLAPASPWPAGARDVGAAISWLHQNIDLFGGSTDEIITVGYSAGAFHVASYLGHPEFQAPDAGIAGAVLVSGIYAPEPNADPAEKSYFGTDPSKYPQRSALPGILEVETSILLAWSALDPARLIEQGEKLKELMCNAPAHCPRTTVLRRRDNLASIFATDASGGSLAQSTLELVREIEARGLP
jgi:acetyl esterase/lipase